MALPVEFCWSKFGTEAGEAPSSIFERKEIERLNNDGTFLWGIGSSIRPSLLDLLSITARPEVVFTPMLSRPAPRDVTPEAVGAWRSAAGIDGKPYAMPRHSLVTSSLGGRKSRHYALVCHRDTPIPDTTDEQWIDDSDLRNLRSGTRVGSSQVTSVVRRSLTEGTARKRYRVAFLASLQSPYLVELTDCVRVSVGDRA